MIKVKELSNLAGISVRALHLYDKIGLLKPTERSKSGYRLYDDKALKTLYQILFFHNLKISLKEIKVIIENPNFNCNQILQTQRNILVKEIKRLERLIDSIDENTEKSYEKRIDSIFKKLAEKRGCPPDSFEVKQLIDKYGHVMKQITQIKNEAVMMKNLACFQNTEPQKSETDNQYGEGTAEFIAQAINAFYQ